MLPNILKNIWVFLLIFYLRQILERSSILKNVSSQLKWHKFKLSFVTSLLITLSWSKFISYFKSNSTNVLYVRNGRFLELGRATTYLLETFIFFRSESILVHTDKTSKMQKYLSIFLSSFIWKDNTWLRQCLSITSQICGFNECHHINC